MNNDHYQKAVEWIALEDEPLINDEYEIQDQTTVAMLADVFGHLPIHVAIDVLECRTRINA